MPKVTVILTSYNHEKFIAEAIESVLNQTYTDFELIILDDASTDNSWNIIKSYNDPRIRAFKNTVNKLGDFSEVFPDTVSGEYFAKHHSDDAWEPIKLEKQVAFLDSHPEISAVFTYVQIVDEAGEVLKKTDHPYYKVFEQPNRSRYEWLNYFFYVGNCLCHPSILIKRDCYENFDSRWGFHQLPDFDKWVRLCQKEEIYILQEKLVRFRVRDDELNTSGNRPDSRVRSQYELLQVLNQYRSISTVEELLKIFPSANIYINSNHNDILYMLGRVATEDSNSNIHKLFGLNLLFEALNNPERAKIIQEADGFDEKQFVELTGHNDIFSIETCSNLNTLLLKSQEDILMLGDNLKKAVHQLADTKAQLAEIHLSRAWKLSLVFHKTSMELFPPRSLQRQMAKKLIFYTKKIASRLRKGNDLRLIQTSALFDKIWYLEKYPDVAKANIDPAFHYLHYGAFEKRDPSPRFSSEWYLETYPDVAREHINPLIHYIRYGKKEGRLPITKKHYRSTNLSFFSALFIFTKKHGGIKSVLLEAYRSWRNHGLKYFIFSLLEEWSLLKSSYHNTITSPIIPENDPLLLLNIVPYYLNPYYIVPSKRSTQIPNVGIHLHLDSIKVVNTCVSYLEKVDFPFSLFISFTCIESPLEIEKVFKEKLPLVEKIITRKTPDRGGHLAPLIIEFGQELLKYDLIAHLHTLSPTHLLETIEGIFSSASVIHQIVELLQKDGKVVYHASNRKNLLDSSGWAGHFTFAKFFAKRYLRENLDEYTQITFPQEGIFWATASAIKEFLNLDIKYDDFINEQITRTSALHETLLRLILIMANKVSGMNYCLYAPDNTIHEPGYEEQHDYSNTLLHNKVKVLSYYLPQFYPIPENDSWHGKGFTEWYKVRSANPLFYNHYQQRIPHNDFGYYSLTNPEILRKQFALMNQAGIYGQVFYHYWFTGKLILEKPAQMLLADPSIDMPFCFCWANENWTKKWDGNESEIILQQNYSEQDAIDFINYLIQFFKDKRYITVQNRPVLFVYRPASIPDFSIYKHVWRDICKSHNIAQPYIIAILTRGATDPRDFDMDAGCERVLHDWTNGAVPNMKEAIYKYKPINASILDYNQVAGYYMDQSSNYDFTYIRSIIPSWDNTPRYGSDALIIHNSSPKKFQQWLNYLVNDAEQRLPEDRRFVLVNAWNEWAESAYLDPDKRFGYAYLNSIGRTLSNIPYDNREYLLDEISGDLVITITFSEFVLDVLKDNEELKRKTLTCLINSTIFSRCKIVFSQREVEEWIMAVSSNSNYQLSSNQGSDYSVDINKVCYVTPDALENMLKLAIRYRAAMVIPTTVNDKEFTHAGLGNRWECSADLAKTSPLHLSINSLNNSCSIKCCVDARVFISDIEKDTTSNFVSTIIRFHNSGEFELLENSLYSLLAQTSCNVQPIIAVQDLSRSQLSKLNEILQKIPFSPSYPPLIKKYFSDGSVSDLRSAMLNNEFIQATSDYVAFLDFDDILFPNAYRWLLSRLLKTNKNATFGLIYTKNIKFAEKQIKNREIFYDYGKNYNDFYNNNHTPIHGFMINKARINTDNIQFVENMKYMEDYYLTLQIFNEKDTDWNSLNLGQFIGDYNKFEDKPQTLGNITEEKRKSLCDDIEYEKCLNMINKLRETIIR